MWLIFNVCFYIFSRLIDDFSRGFNVFASASDCVAPSQQRQGDKQCSKFFHLETSFCDAECMSGKEYDDGTYRKQAKLGMGLRHKVSSQRPRLPAKAGP